MQKQRISCDTRRKKKIYNKNKKESPFEFSHPPILSAGFVSDLTGCSRVLPKTLYFATIRKYSRCCMCVFQSHPAQDNYFSPRSRSPPPPSPPFSFFLPVGVYTLANTFTRYECLSFFSFISYFFKL